MSELVRVKFRVKSVGIKPGDAAYVSEEEAARLVANGHAIRTAYQPKVGDEPARTPAKKAAKKV